MHAQVGGGIVDRHRDTLAARSDEQRACRTLEANRIDCSTDDQEATAAMLVTAERNNGFRRIRLARLWPF